MSGEGLFMSLSVQQLVYSSLTCARTISARLHSPGAAHYPDGQRDAGLFEPEILEGFLFKYFSAFGRLQSERVMLHGKSVQKKKTSEWVSAAEKHPQHSVHTILWIKSIQQMTYDKKRRDPACRGLQWRHSQGVISSGGVLAGAL